ncbi:MAG: UPF0272 protein [Pirellulaceae bacterium]|nr:MAG: UPF0272 protein [Pirellulaceae bacterium]GIW95703.1 MAG: UPF0272 protein [Pirellulaceae bacterium]
MKVVYIDCHSGISGDMMLGALVDAGVPLEAIQAGIDSLGLPECRLESSIVKRKGFRATKISVRHADQKAHRHLHHITELIDRSSLTDRQKILARQLFTRLGEAEARVHNTTIEKVHFHEVGAVDSIADIVGVAIAWDLLAPERTYCSPVPVGGGTIQIAHGSVSVPAPATAELLKGIPLAESSVPCELTTPTGATFLATLVDQFGPMPAMTVDAIGYGAGDRDLAEQPNLLRIFVGQSEEGVASDVVWVLETNLDDVPAELIGHCMNRLCEAGALDVFATAVQMKKNRPGVQLTVLCDRPAVEKLEAIIFRETGTLGIRRWQTSRHTLPRRRHVVSTAWGPVQGVVAQTPDGHTLFSPEYDSCRLLAEQHGVALREVYQAAVMVFSRPHADSAPNDNV